MNTTLRAALAAFLTMLCLVEPAAAQVAATQTLQRPDIAALQAVHHGNLSAGSVGLVADATRGGEFQWVTGDQSAACTADTAGAEYVAASSNASCSLGAWKRAVRDGVYEARFWGITTAATDNYSAFATACGYVSGKTTATLAFGPGTYRMGAAVSCSLAAAGKAMTLRGEGDGVTILKFDGASTAGITITGRQENPLLDTARLNLRDLSIYTDRARATSDAFVYDGQVAASGTLNQGVRVENSTIQGTASGAYWRTGVYVKNASSAHVENVTVNGSRPSAYAPANLLGVGLKIDASGDHFIKGFRAYELDKGLKVESTTEGVYVTQSTFVTVNDGIDWQTTWPEPLLTVSQTHFNAYKNCVITAGVVQSAFTDNLCYWLGDTVGVGTTSSTWTGFNLVRADDTTLKGNIISVSGRSEVAGGITQNPFYIVNVDRVTLTGNIVTGTSSYINGAAFSLLDARTVAASNNLISGAVTGFNIADAGADGVGRPDLVSVTGGTLSGIRDIGVSYNSTLNGFFGGVVCKGSAPALGWWGTAAEGGRSGSITIGQHACDDTTLTLVDSAATYKVGDTTPWTTATAASTLDLSKVRSVNVLVSGSTAITSFGTAQSGTFRRLRFSGTPTVTYNATSLIIPGAASLTMAANDVLEAVSLGGGNWFAYRVNGGGSAGTDGSYTPTATTQANLDGVTTYAANYYRVGNKMTMFGRADIDATATGGVQYGLAFPISSNVSDAGDCAGAVTEDGNGNVGTIRADTTNKRLQFNIIASSTTARGTFWSASCAIK